MKSTDNTHEPQKCKWCGKRVYPNITQKYLLLPGVHGYASRSGTKKQTRSTEKENQRGKDQRY